MKNTSNTSITHNTKTCFALLSLLFASVFLMSPTPVGAIEDPPGCSTSNGGLGNSSSQGIGFLQPDAHIGDTVTMTANIGMVAGACSAINATGARVVAEACLIDRSGGKAKLGVELIALASLKIPAWEAHKLPPHLASTPAVKPGSRGLA